jgi:hypothetical protein
MTTPATPPSPPAKPPQAPPSPWATLHPLVQVGLVGAAALLGIVAAGKIAAALTPPPRVRLPRQRKLDLLEEALLAQQATPPQVAVNQKNGKLLERATDRDLRAANPDARVHYQVPMRDADRRRHVLDHVVAHEDGVVFAAESKNVDELDGQHLEQILAAGKALEDNGYEIGGLTLKVAKRTVVSEGIAARAAAANVNIERVLMRKRRLAADD